MKWVKKGMIFCPLGQYDWMVSHAANPVAEPLGEGLFRVYFSSRDGKNRSSIGWVEMDIRNPHEVLKLSPQPLIRRGDPGYFDDSGTSMGFLVMVDGKKYLYYLGWNLGVTVPWRNSIGLAINDSKEVTFRKFSRAPLLDRNEVDPFSLSYPSILREGIAWKMWYGSNLSWGVQEKDMAHVIKYAESSDGIRWERKGWIAIPLQSPNEYAISRPSVLKDGDRYRMWYSYRGESYRIGYAESADGLHWQRKDEEAGIDVSETGWDSKMIEYPFVFDCQGKRYMLYNGNGYGRTGIGLAVLSPED
jgi:predicted GH43/DUF377 family glycosyl hydrolase